MPATTLGAGPSICASCEELVLLVSFDELGGKSSTSDSSGGAELGGGPSLWGSCEGAELGGGPSICGSCEGAELGGGPSLCGSCEEVPSGPYLCVLLACLCVSNSGSSSDSSDGFLL